MKLHQPTDNQLNYFQQRQALGKCEHGRDPLRCVTCRALDAIEEAEQDHGWECVGSA